MNFSRAACRSAIPKPAFARLSQLIPICGPNLDGRLIRHEAKPLSTFNDAARCEDKNFFQPDKPASCRRVNANVPTLNCGPWALE